MNTKRAKDVNTPPPTPRPCHVVSNEHVGNYVLMEITGRDEDGYEVGHVLEVSSEEEPLHNRLIELLRQKSGRQFALFRGKRTVVSGPELEKAARKFVQDFYEAKEAARRAGR